MCHKPRDTLVLAVDFRFKRPKNFSDYNLNKTKKEKHKMEQINSAGKTALEFTKGLPQAGGKIIAEYVWIDGAGGMRAKCRTLEKKV